MQAPFGKGSGEVRLECLARRMAADPQKSQVMVYDSPGLKVRATFDDHGAPKREPFVYVEYGFVLATGQKGDPHNTEDGHLDQYDRVSLTYAAMDRLVAAYQARRGTQEGRGSAEAA